MFGKKKEKEVEAKITDIKIDPLNVFLMKVITDDGESSTIEITTNLDESKLKQLLNGYIAENGFLDPNFRDYIIDNGYEHRMMVTLANGKGLKNFSQTWTIYNNDF